MRWGIRAIVGGSFGEIFFADSAEVRPHKPLLQVALCFSGFARSGSRLGDALNERDSCWRNAVQKTTVFGGNLRVHINCLSEDLE